jgi:tetratricopeptide (TPR) repeat protein
MPPSVRDRLLALAGPLLLFAITFVVFSPSLGHGFIFDDAGYLVDNAPLHAPDALRHIWLDSSMPNYYPIFFTLLRGQWLLWGDSPWGYHFVNVLLHSLNVVLLYLLLAKMRAPLPWLAALLFAVHPLNVQTVAWVSEQKNTLSFLFLLAAAFCLITESSVLPSWRRFLLAMVFFVCSLLSKSSLVMFPVFLTGLWLYQGKLKSSRAAAQLGALYLLSLGAGLLAIWFEKNRVQSGSPLHALGLPGHVALAGGALWANLQHAFLPTHLAPFYQGWAPEEQMHPAWWPDLLLALGFAGLVYLARSRKAAALPLLAAFFYYAAMLTPFLGFMSSSYFQWSIVVDHWQYPALPGIVVIATQLLSLAVSRLPTMRTAAVAAAGGACACWLASITFGQLPFFRDEVTFARYGVDRNQGAWGAWYNLGAALFAQGHYDTGIGAFMKAVELHPTSQAAQWSLANDLLRVGRFSEAEVHYQQALKIDPTKWDLWGDLGLLYSKTGRDREAESCFRRASSIAPEKDAATLSLLAQKYRHSKDGE